MPTEKKYKTFWSFYTYWLTGDTNPVNRLLNFTGTCLIIIFLIAGIILKNRWIVVAIPFFGYGLPG